MAVFCHSLLLAALPFRPRIYFLRLLITDPPFLRLLRMLSQKNSIFCVFFACQFHAIDLELPFEKSVFGFNTLCLGPLDENEVNSRAFGKYLVK